MLESKLGKIFIIVYTLFTIGVYVYVALCTGEQCFSFIVLPIMPWASIFVLDLGINFPWIMYPVFILLNVSVVYVLGLGIEWVYQHTLNKE